MNSFTGIFDTALSPTMLPHVLTQNPQHILKKGLHVCNAFGKPWVLSLENDFQSLKISMHMHCSISFMVKVMKVVYPTPHVTHNFAPN